MKEEVENSLNRLGNDLGLNLNVDRLKDDLFTYFKATEIKVSYQDSDQTEIVPPIIISADDDIFPYELVIAWSGEEYNIALVAAIGGQRIGYDIIHPKTGVEFVYDRELKLNNIRFRYSHETGAL